MNLAFLALLPAALLIDRLFGELPSRVHPVCMMGALASRMEALLRRGAQTLILGCTELPLAETLYHLDYPVTDPTLELALAAIRFAGGETVE